jgi:hypothetical protein
VPQDPPPQQRLPHRARDPVGFNLEQEVAQLVELVELVELLLLVVGQGPPLLLQSNQDP